MYANSTPIPNPQRCLRLYLVSIHMSPSIRVSDETKRMLTTRKREDETFDDLLARSERPITIGAWSANEAGYARTAVKRSRESFER